MTLNFLQKMYISFFSLFFKDIRERYKLYKKCNKVESSLKVKRPETIPTIKSAILPKEHMFEIRMKGNPIVKSWSDDQLPDLMELSIVSKNKDRYLVELTEKQVKELRSI